MVHVLGFGSHEAMIEHLRLANAAALADLHPTQRALTYGDTWAHFPDIANNHIVFGEVFTLHQVRIAELEAGATKAETEQAIVQTQSDMSHGLMYGRGYDRFNPDGELCRTHKIGVWPIEREAFDAALAVKFQFAAMPLAQRLNLALAYRALRGA